jgi:hypothetical protein
MNGDLVPQLWEKLPFYGVEQTVTLKLRFIAALLLGGEREEGWDILNSIEESTVDATMQHPHDIIHAMRAFGVCAAE